MPQKVFVAILILLLSVGISFSVDFRVFLMPGGEFFSGTTGWTISGGAGIEDYGPIPWGFGVWYGYSAAETKSLSSKTHQGGLWADFPLSLQTIPITIVPIIYTGLKIDNLKSGTSADAQVLGFNLEPGLEVRLLSLKPLEISLYGSFCIEFGPYTSKSVRAGLSAAYSWAIPRNNGIQAVGVNLTKNNQNTNKAVNNNTTLVKAAESILTNKELSVSERFENEIRSVLENNNQPVSVKETNSSTNLSASTNTTSVKVPETKLTSKEIPARTNIQAIAVNVTRTNSNTNLTAGPNISLVKEDEKPITNKDTPSLEKKNGELVIRFSEVLFDENSTNVESRNIALIQGLGKTFQKYTNLMVIVEGFTDNVGDNDNNLKLSEMRAKAVADILYKTGINPLQVKCQGYGSQRPCAPNDTVENRAKNRRVEIHLNFVDKAK